MKIYLKILIKAKCSNEIFFLLFLSFVFFNCQNNTNLPNFTQSIHFNEQIFEFNFNPDVTIRINAPSGEAFDPLKEIKLILYALPNGNTIDQTVGKIIKKDNDWHFDIQHIGAQTRFLRNHLSNFNIVTVYLQTKKRSWPLWKREHKNYSILIKSIINKIRSIFSNYKNDVILTGHSGGGSFIFGFMDAFNEIPDFVERISFLDSDYGYTNFYGKKIAGWLNSSKEKYLCVLAYNDSIALLNGKPFVSDTGGTWVRTKMMKKYLSKQYDLAGLEDNEFYKYSGLNGRIKILLKKNPKREILHTVQVERNGFIEAILSGTKYENKGYIYYGARAYSEYIQK